MFQIISVASISSWLPFRVFSLPSSGSRRVPASARVLCLSLLAAAQLQAARALKTQPSRGALAANVDGTAHPASFFSGFSQGESTYDEDADLERQSRYTDGWAPSVKDRYERNLLDPGFFHESPSGGSEVAWQTYPLVGKDHAGFGGEGESWSHTAGGGWKQEYSVLQSAVPSGKKDYRQLDIKSGAGKMQPGFFDSGVDQYDTFGRRKLPYMANPRRFVGWQERSVNTTLQCAEPGCIATATLNAFDSSVERGRGCRLDVYVHATDFDDQYSGEQVDWIEVNDVNVSIACQPLASGCNATAARPVYPCVRSLSLDGVVPINGQLRLKAKIPDVVDECAYEGSLLYAIPTVTCLISDPIPLPLFQEVGQEEPVEHDENETLLLADFAYGATGSLECPPAYGPILNEAECDAAHEYLGIQYNGVQLQTHSHRLPYCWASALGWGNFNPHGDVGSNHDHARLICKLEMVTSIESGQFNVTAPLRCQEAGCQATTLLDFSRLSVETVQQCDMTILLNATDFDNSDWDNDQEHVSIRVGGIHVATVTPGVNPCRSRYHGNPLPAHRFMNIPVISGYNVTEEVRHGQFMVQATLSSVVDECASEGHLLDAKIVVSCANQTRY